LPIAAPRRQRKEGRLFIVELFMTLTKFVYIKIISAPACDQLQHVSTNIKVRHSLESQHAQMREIIIRSMMCHTSHHERAIVSHLQQNSSHSKTLEGFEYSAVFAFLHLPHFLSVAVEQ
jgi:uncharacterized membrane protein